MKPLSEKFEKVLEQASTDPVFAEKLIENTDEAISSYNLTNLEKEQLKSYESEEEIRNEYYFLKGHPFSIPQRFKMASRRNPFSLVVSLIITIGIVIFFLANVLFPEILEHMGIPVWNKMGPTTKSILLIYCGSLFIGSLLYLMNSLKGLATPKRYTIFIVLTFLIIIPILIALILLPFSHMVTLVFSILILIFTVLPASFYPLFISSKRQTLWGEFIYNLECLDPIGNKKLKYIYRKKYESLYGQINDGIEGTNLFSGETPFPVMLNTIIIALGWSLYFFGPAYGDLFDFGGSKSPFVFGFMGAYWFSMQMLFRRYVQSDLKTTAYSHSSQRILVTWVFALVLIVIFSGSDSIVTESIPEANVNESLPGDSLTKIPIVCVLAFIVGVFPEVAWQVIANLIKRALGVVIPTFKQEHPLNKIDGITVWTEARLLEQDIENIQNLVTTNIVDLVLETNFDPMRIVHWIDQGILHLHFSQNQNSRIQNELNKRGIFTATDLLINYSEYQKKQNNQKPFLDKIENSMVECIVNSIENDPNIYHIKAWRNIKQELNNQLPKAVKNQVKKIKDN